MRALQPVGFKMPSFHLRRTPLRLFLPLPLPLFMSVPLPLSLIGGSGTSGIATGGKKGNGYWWMWGARTCSVGLICRARMLWIALMCMFCLRLFFLHLFDGRSEEFYFGSTDGKGPTMAVVPGGSCQEGPLP